jgi:hypothetical protein
MGFYQRHWRLATLFDQQHDDRIWATLSPEQQQQALALLGALLAEIIHNHSPQPNQETKGPVKIKIYTKACQNSIIPKCKIEKL